MKAIGYDFCSWYVLYFRFYSLPAAELRELIELLVEIRAEDFPDGQVRNTCCCDSRDYVNFEALSMASHSHSANEAVGGGGGYPQSSVNGNPPVRCACVSPVSEIGRGCSALYSQ